jgi:hypothetical protein
MRIGRFAEQVGDKVATDPMIVEKVVKKNTDLINDLINEYKNTH